MSTPQQPKPTLKDIVHGIPAGQEAVQEAVEQSHERMERTKLAAIVKEYTGHTRQDFISAVMAWHKQPQQPPKAVPVASELETKITHLVSLIFTDGSYPDKHETFKDDCVNAATGLFLELFQQHQAKETALAVIDAKIEALERLKSDNKFGFQKLNLTVDYIGGTNSGVIPYRKHWNDCYERFEVTVNEHITALQKQRAAIRGEGV
jgi:hypothetical protein